MHLTHGASTVAKYVVIAHKNDEEDGLITER